MFEARSHIGGRWIESPTPTHVLNPWSGSPVARAHAASLEQVDEAVAAASRAYSEYSGWPAHRRAAVLRKAAGIIEARAEEAALSITRENAKSRASSMVEVQRVVETLHSSADAAMNLAGVMLPLDASPRGEGKLGFTLRVPVGVVAAITPFNSPMNLAAHKLGPALAAGNTVVLKPHPQTPSCNVLLLEALMEAGLPAGAANLVLGDGSVGERLVKHDEVRIVSFTGGGANAARIRAVAGSKKLLLELGGNNGNIVLADADLDRAVADCVSNAFGYQGQSCISVQRIFVHRSIYDGFVEAFVKRTLALKVGDPSDPATNVGPLVDASAAERIEAWLNEAVSQGARILCGGKREGAVLTPAVVVDAPPKSRLACEEVFGPVALIDPFDTLEEAIARVNDSRYGLQAGLFTRSIGAMLKAIRGLEVGGVVINGTSNTRVDLQPYGGVKESGAGREGPAFAIEEMTEIKTVLISG